MILETLAIYVGIPIAAFGVITILVLAPSLIRGSGYRPGRAWRGQPQWFGDRPPAAVPDRMTTDRSTVGGGASGSW